ncbi:GNAT family N-acetyltransferase [Nonomuraea mesophila]|uniref:GNAT family N-acetyltransferase n=1 Tax=Nonomuraea mesophila TaxID=2530382 RepID=A0A4R5FDW7_9ACTN|nr:GNAT family N-acetyltransferase [Nonomuraea mesophila]TDE47872.1 GNAT family N-acetyltransferase [Nonomuraea mesophila]
MTTPTVDVRPATRADAALLARLNDVVHAVHVAARPDVFRAASSQDELVALFDDFLRRENALAFIARSSGEAVGYATATLHERSGDVLTRPRSFVALEHLAVDPGAARVGIGTALVDAVRTAGKEAGCPGLANAAVKWSPCGAAGAP